MKRISLLVAILSIAFSLRAADKPALPTSDAVTAVIKERIDVRKQGVGIVVGLIDASGRRVVAHGTFDSDRRPVDGDTLFEIGSVTKVFTSLLLTDAVARGEVALDDPIGKYLPATVKVPERNGRKITLVDLATHTSGLPRLPSNLLPQDPANPYAGYTAEQAGAFLSSFELPRDPGSKYEYSNFGAGLLGQILSARAGVDFETLVQKRITTPLAMSSTVVNAKGLEKRLAPGHDAQGARVANWDFQAMAGAGALRSTANDLLRFLAANLGLAESPLTPSMAAMLGVKRPTPIPATEIAIGWHVTTRGGRTLVWHNGGTAGYRSFVGFDPKQRTGVVVLSNMFTDGGVDDLGLHFLDSSAPLAAAPKARKEIQVAAEVLEKYVGRYELAPGFVLTVTRDGSRLFTQATGQPMVEVFAESERDFFLKVTDAQLTFDADGSKLVLHQGGRDMPAKRLAGAAPAPVERKQVAVDAAVLEKYAGSYQLAPNFILTISRDGDRLFLQATGQAKNELFAESATKFFLKVVDAQVVFVVDESGRAKSVVLHQNGAEVPGKRME